MKKLVILLLLNTLFIGGGGMFGQEVTKSHSFTKKHHGSRTVITTSKGDQQNYSLALVFMEDKHQEVLDIIKGEFPDFDGKLISNKNEDYELNIEMGQKKLKVKFKTSNSEKLKEEFSKLKKIEAKLTDDFFIEE